MKPGSSPRRKDVVVLILDCVRTSELPGGQRPVPGLDFLRRLHAESAIFPKTVAAAPWTLPSHRSLLTGRYPWESAIAADETQWSLPTALRDLGYRTLLLSGNPLLGELPGVGAQFDQVFVSHWWEPFFRPGLPLGPVTVGPAGRERRAGPIESLRGAMRLLPLVLTRFPEALTALSRGTRRLRGNRASSELVLAPWLESTLEAWLRTVPSTEPVCCVINLSDAHEPYLESSADLVARPLGAHSAVRQDSVGWLMGGWDPSGSEARILERLYRDAVGRLDGRLERLCQIFRGAGRWDDSVVTLTSDHGQAFGEHGMFFHGHRVDETLVRVPLWVRVPGGDSLPVNPEEWTSHVDVAATLYSEATGLRPPATSGVPLRILGDRGRGGPVFSESTGIQPERAHLISADRRDLLHCHRLAGYIGSRKAVVESPGGRVLVYDLDRDPNEQTPLAPSGDAASRSLVESVRSVLASTEQPAEPLPRVDRLVSWGYA